MALNIGVLVDKLGQRFGVSSQPISPLLDGMKKVARCSGLSFKVGELLLNRLDIDTAHDLANVLHLSPAALSTVNAGMYIDGDAQRVRKLQSRSNLGFELRKLQADFL